MLTLFMVATLTIAGSELPEPVYVLEYPGLGFEFLPPEMSPPVEGTVSEDAGVIASPPNSSGIEYRLYYWKEHLEANTRKDQWLSERFADIVSPDLLPSLLIGEVDWVEGSTESPRRETSSIGLVPALNFNSIDSAGSILGRGRACAIFTDGYSVLFYAMAPGNADADIIEEMDGIISRMYRLAD
ncbi:MAG: hypothetical protein JXA64_03890 [Candidatus Fermentibacteraceae bacterium]|nr:hypothetical protein [Candidatus Fermentibacteraceae bacterium]MBN2608233.1 hypothetical protein [Candidatus Fermentibacteraceae bacterium]